MNELARRRDPAEIRRGQFYAFLRGQPEDAQDFVAGLSGLLLEPDIYEMYSKDPVRIQAISDSLLNLGVKKPNVQKILSFFNLLKQPVSGGK